MWLCAQSQLLLQVIIINICDLNYYEDHPNINNNNSLYVFGIKRSKLKNTYAKHNYRYFRCRDSRTVAKLHGSVAMVTDGVVMGGIRASFKGMN